MASFSSAQKAAIENQVTASSDTYAAISGIWTSSFALGNFIGPSIGGFLFDLINFRYTTLIFQIVGLCLLVCVDLFRILKMKKKIVLKKVNGHKMDLYERL